MERRVLAVKCSSYENKEVQKALEEIFNLMDFKFKKNIRVLIKPNVLGAHEPDSAITTHPVVLEEICKILKKYNAKIFIGDGSGEDTEKSLKVSGIEKVAKKYGTLINFDKEKTYTEQIKGKIKQIHLPNIIKEVDLIINVAKLKTHIFTNITGAVKNLYGFIPGNAKSFYHRLLPKSKEFSELLLEIYKKIKPQLNIIDGVVGIEGMGPGTTGEKIKSNIILASEDAIALDIVASEIMGFHKNEVLTNKLAIKDGLFNDHIKVLGNGKDIRMNFKKPSNLPGKIFFSLGKIIPKPKIAFNKDKCIKCRACERKCPAKAISFADYPVWNKNKCIYCFCCIEICPKNAIYLKEHFIFELGKKIKNWGS